MDDNSKINIINGKIDIARQMAKDKGSHFSGGVENSRPIYFIHFKKGLKKKKLAFPAPRNFPLATPPKTDGEVMVMIGLFCTHDKVMYNQVKKILGKPLTDLLVDINTDTMISSTNIH